MNEKVDVLIIGSGASGAAVAWSLADTKMRILCLEQGDWVKPTDYPSNGRDWEARLFGDFAINPNRRARETDYPINDANSPIKVVNFNGVGGSTIMYTAHYPRLHPSDFKVKTLDGVDRTLVTDDLLICEGAGEPFPVHIDDLSSVMRCQERGGRLVARDDDRPEVVRQRLVVYHEQTQPLLAFYESIDMLQRIDASGPPAEVARSALAALGTVQEQVGA